MPTATEDSHRLQQASAAFAVIGVIGLVLGLAFATHLFRTNSGAGNAMMAVAAWLAALGAARVALRTRRAARAARAADAP